jgi:hypothetical protein
MLMGVFRAILGIVLCCLLLLAKYKTYFQLEGDPAHGRTLAEISIARTFVGFNYGESNSS